MREVFWPPTKEVRQWLEKKGGEKLEKSIYMQLKKKAMPLIEAYHTDLTIHDKRWLRENPGVPFLHFTGETGTHLTRLDTKGFPKKGERISYLFGTATREEILESNLSVVPDMKHRYGRGKLAMYFDGTRLREISYRRAASIAKDYEERVLSQWNSTLRILDPEKEKSYGENRVGGIQA